MMRRNTASAMGRSGDPWHRIAELEAELAAREQESREAKDRYQELRHRIRNELQGFTSLLAFQARVANQPDYCKRCILRLASAAELHDVLDDGGFEVISMASYLPALSHALEKFFDDRVGIETIVEPGINLDPRRTQCLGLIYAEAAMNAQKHAFPGDLPGRLKVQFRRSGDAFEMTMTDNGVGFEPASVQPGQGMRLMQELARELQGALYFQRLSAGMRVRLTFAARDA